MAKKIKETEEVEIKKEELKVETPKVEDTIKAQRLADCQELIRLMNEFGISIEPKVYMILEELKK
jgi:hypothetical protein